MRFLVTVDRDRAGMWVMTCPAIPGCALRAKTPEEADSAMKHAIRSLLEIQAGRRLALTVELLKYYIIKDRSPDDIVWKGERERIAELLRTGAEPGLSAAQPAAKSVLGSLGALPETTAAGWGSPRSPKAP